jgi:hypothetical protein
VTVFADLNQYVSTVSNENPAVSIAIVGYVRAESLLLRPGCRLQPGIQSPAACTVTAKFSATIIARTTRQCPVGACYQNLVGLNNDGRLVGLNNDGRLGKQ